MSKSFYQQFSNKKKNSAVKEGFKQAKRKAKKERAAAIDLRFEEKRKMRDAARALSLEATDPNSKRNFKNKKEVKPAKEASAVTPAAPEQKTAPAVQPKQRKGIPVKSGPMSDALMPLNKYLAHCGVCSRREAVSIIKEGKVKVNGQIILEPAFKVTEKDEVISSGKALFVSKNLVYILLNKPKDYITTTDDPQGRKTVLQLTKMATTERIYPVGRLDRNTSGVLLLTNDGELTQKLSHPSYNITKVYEVKLDKELTKADFEKILNGLTLEDGEIKVDTLAYADSRDKSVIGIEIHSGRNRIVRRIFESLGYDVKALDRVMYANLTKKNVERGKWRFLSEKEVRLLKYMNASYKTKSPKKDAPAESNADDEYTDEFDFAEAQPVAAPKKFTAKKQDFKKPASSDKDQFKKKYAGKGAHKDGLSEAKPSAAGSNKYEKTKPASREKTSERALMFKELALKKGRDKAAGESTGGYNKNQGGLKSKPTHAGKAPAQYSKDKAGAEGYEKPASSAFKSNRDKLKIANKRPVKK